MGATSVVDPLLWMGLVALAACLGGIAARAAGWPAAAGALGAGLVIGSIAMAAGSPPPRGNPLWEMPSLLAVAWLCLLAGAEWAAGLARGAPRGGVVAGALVSAACVLAAVWPAAMMAGLPAWAAFVAAACCVAGSPLVVVAVTAEVRARGEASSHALAAGTLSALAGLGLVVAAAIVWGRFSLVRIAAGVVLGGWCGVVLLFPLSRLGSRASIVPCLVLGVTLLAGTALWLAPAPASILPLALSAGYVMMRFMPEPGRVLDTLRDLAVPAAAIWAVQAAAGLQGPPGATALLVAALVGARAVGLFAADMLVPGPAGRTGAAGVAARIATTSSMVMMPVVSMLAEDPRSGRLVPALLTTSVVTNAIGLVALRRALARAGDVPSQDDPGAWRDRMR